MDGVAGCRIPSVVATPTASALLENVSSVSSADASGPTATVAAVAAPVGLALGLLLACAAYYLGCARRAMRPANFKKRGIASSFGEAVRAG